MGGELAKASAAMSTAWLTYMVSYLHAGWLTACLCAVALLQWALSLFDKADWLMDS